MGKERIAPCRLASWAVAPLQETSENSAVQVSLHPEGRWRTMRNALLTVALQDEGRASPAISEEKEREARSPRQPKPPEGKGHFASRLFTT